MFTETLLSTQVEAEHELSRRALNVFKSRGKASTVTSQVQSTTAVNVFKSRGRASTVSSQVQSTTVVNAER